MMAKQKRSVAAGAKHHLKHTFVPHKTNKYRPHLIKWQGLTVVIVLSLLLQFVYGVIETGNFVAFARASDINQTELLEETNRARDIEGAPPLVVSETLNKAAELKAQDMLANDYWAHVSPTGVEPWKWLADVNYGYRQAGENLAKNYPDANATVDAWMASPTHRANMLDKAYSEVGFAVADGEISGEATTLVVAYYGAPADLTALGQASTSGGANNTVYATPVGVVKSPLDYIGATIQAMNPPTLITLALLTVIGGIALLAHFQHRSSQKLSKELRRHNGLIMFVAAAGISVLMMLATTGGEL